MTRVMLWNHRDKAARESARGGVGAGGGVTAWVARVVMQFRVRTTRRVSDGTQAFLAPRCFDQLEIGCCLQLTVCAILCVMPG